MLIIGSLLLTIGEYLYSRVVLKLNGEQAYLYCSAEQEAYRHHHDTTYLLRRKRFAQFAYLRNKKPLCIKENGVVEGIE